MQGTNKSGNLCTSYRIYNYLSLVDVPVVILSTITVIHPEQFTKDLHITATHLSHVNGSSYWVDKCGLEQSHCECIERFNDRICTTHAHNNKIMLENLNYV